MRKTAGGEYALDRRVQSKESAKTHLPVKNVKWPEGLSLHCGGSAKEKRSGMGRPFKIDKDHVSKTTEEQGKHMRGGGRREGPTPKRSNNEETRTRKAVSKGGEGKGQEEMTRKHKYNKYEDPRSKNPQAKEVERRESYNRKKLTEADRKLRDMEDEGHCCFLAFGHQMNERLGYTRQTDRETSDRYRSIAAEALEKEREKLKEREVVDEWENSKEEEKERCRTGIKKGKIGSSGWGGTTTLLALAEYYSIRVTITNGEAWARHRENMARHHRN